MAEYVKKSDVIAYIRKEAEEAQSAFEELGGESGIIAEAYEDLASELEDFTAADVAPVRHGRWIKTIEENEDEDYPIRNTLYICSECKTRELSERNYCPCCGSRMDGAE